jgi:hypothetical protein
MTAHDLIDSIFSQAAWGVAAANVRRITPRQLLKLRELIDEDPEGGAAKPGAPGSLVWMPSGRHKYILTEDLHGTKHTLTRLSNICASESGRLF